MLKRFRGLDETLPYILLAAGLTGLVASLGLMLERLALVENPESTALCNINPFVNCGGIIEAGYGSAFGLPDPLLGIIAFSVVATIGATLVAGARLQRWFWLGLQLGVIFGLGFMAWLYYQTLYVIGILCPYCMAVWVAMVPLFWYVTLYNLRHYFRLPRRWRGASDWLQRHHGDVLLSVYIFMFGLLLIEFWDQLSLLW